MSTRYATDLMVVELKEELKKLDLSGADCKNKIINEFK
jgi:hypothetical protein